MRQLGSRAIDSEHPFDTRLGFVALFFPGGDLCDQLLAVTDLPIEALTTQDANLDFHHVEPACVLGRVMEFQAAQHTVSLGRRKSFIESTGSVSGQIIALCAGR